MHLTLAFQECYEYLKDIYPYEYLKEKYFKYIVINMIPILWNLYSYCIF